ncbi:hypothetical protein J6590_085345 [Homalodisca vitripennis]|nr:hypothetical protein J6590_085345 [Homalodisca vitripennis]
MKIRENRHLPTLPCSPVSLQIRKVPYRHNLITDHPVNKQTTLVKYYINELCARCKESVLMEDRDSKMA